MLGAHLMASLSRRADVIGVDRHPWWGDQPLDVRVGDLDDPGFFEQAVRAEAPDILIHCAALANVDACERDPAAADAANAALTRRVAQAAPAGCRVIYISSDGVFPGDAPWSTEEQAPAPRTVYGRSKLEGEREVAQATENHLIVRTNFYGWSSGRKATFGEWLYGALQTQQPLTLFTDCFFTPIYVVDVVERLTCLLEGTHRGIVHVVGNDRVSKYAFGLRMAEVGRFSTDCIRPGSIDQMPSPASRPKDMSLSSERFVQWTGLSVPDARSGLERFLADRGRPLSARCATASRHQASAAW